MIETLNATRESFGLLENRLQSPRSANETRSWLKDIVAGNLADAPGDAGRRCLETLPQRWEVHWLPATTSGLRPSVSSSVANLSFAACPRRSAKMSVPPSNSINSPAHAIPVTT